ncbi:uncharacterized protein LOC122274695 [Carya illinoinensis]|uniref:uncharacterized protein LOC122274695 n=1 Tax=Carya illinoinensis TaxID=32201 RepID=UPI001C71DC9A|nr:uncharacterized protein LOC122274695 [Carya illinoinensis]
MTFRARARAFRASVSSPVYITKSICGSTTPSEGWISSWMNSPNSTSDRHSSSPLARMLTLLRKDDLDIPYLSLMESNMEQQQKVSTSSLPIYLVT